MNNITGCRLLILFIPPVFLLFPVAVLVTILDRIANAIFNQHTFPNWQDGNLEVTLYGPNTTGSTNYTGTDVELNVYIWSTFSMLVTCIFAFLVAALGAFGIWELRRVKSTARHERRWTWTMIIVNILMAGGALGMLGWTSSVQSNEKGWQRYEDVGSGDPEYTRETWICSIQKLYPGQSWAGTVCSIEKANRFLLIPMAISALLVLVSVGILVRNRGGITWLFGGKGIYSGFDSMYELRPTDPFAPHPATQYAVQSAPTWAPHPASNWPAQHAQQSTQQPIPQPTPQSTPQTIPQNQHQGSTANQSVVPQ